jgi:hypothetical protein
MAGNHTMRASSVNPRHKKGKRPTNAGLFYMNGAQQTKKYSWRISLLKKITPIKHTGEAFRKVCISQPSDLHRIKLPVKQKNFAASGFNFFTTRTRKREFLDEMNLVASWTDLVELEGLLPLQGQTQAKSLLKEVDAQHGVHCKQRTSRLATRRGRRNRACRPRAEY